MGRKCSWQSLKYKSCRSRDGHEKDGTPWWVHHFTFRAAGTGGTFVCFFESGHLENPEHNKASENHSYPWIAICSQVGNTIRTGVCFWWLGATIAWLPGCNTGSDAAFPRHLLLFLYNPVLFFLKMEVTMAGSSQMQTDKAPKFDVDTYIATLLSSSPAELHPLLNTLETLYRRKWV